MERASDRRPRLAASRERPRLPEPGTLLAGIAAGRDWLERAAADLLPDALVFARIGLRAAGLPVPGRLRRPVAGRRAEALIPLSSAFRRIAARAADVYLSYDGTPPLARQRGARGAPRRRRSAGRGTVIDRAT